MPVPVYILASTKDNAHREELEKQLAIHRDLLSYWSTTHVIPGDVIAPQIEERLCASRIVVWLISPDFRFMEEQGPEARRALELERVGVLQIVPVLVRITTHYAAPYVGRPVFPDNKVPVSSWNDRDAAWRNVVAGIRRIAQDIAGVAQGYAAPPLASPRSTPAPVSPRRPSAAPPVSAPRPSAAPPVSAPPVSIPVHSNAPPSPRSVAYLPPGVPTPIPPEPSPHRTSHSPAPPTTVNRPSPWRRVAAVLALALAVLVLFLWQTGQSPAAPGPLSPSPASSPSDVCCGGVDCPAERRDAAGTSCATPGMCERCPSGRRLVAGACSDRIPSTDTYRLRLAGVTTPGYVPLKTDTICVQQPGQSPACAPVSSAMTSALPDLVRMDVLTTGPGIDVWFDRGGTRMRTLRGMRLDRSRSHFLRSALCIGAVLHSPSKKDIVRFYLEDP